MGAMSEILWSQKCGKGRRKWKDDTIYKQSKKKIALYRVDGRILDEGIKCDFLFLVAEDKKAFFIELKGSDIEKAVQQILKTVEQLQSSLPKYMLDARIITTRVRTPALKSTYIMKLEKMLRQTGGKLNIKAKFDEVIV